MIKKGLSYLLIAIVLLSVTAIGVSAQDDSVYLESASSTVNAGETTDVAIWINTTGFQGGQINLTYDPSVVNITGFVNESDFPIWYWNSESEGEEWILFAANYSPDLPLEGEYRIGTLTVEGISQGTSELEFGDNSSIFDDHGSETEVSWVGGEISVDVVEGMCGDVNVDGKVTNADAMKVWNRAINENYPLDNEWAADVNCDGKVTNADAMKVWNRAINENYPLNCCQ
ncbi:MAG: dockerin type I domain-containing protein [Candidatus Syntrophoarchaeum sp.]|nr:dockerin type I domain-containing protein [Candidatus Syntrophoarchaeum sp.]